MAELLGVAEVVVVHGFVIGEATGRALTIPDPSEDAEEGDTVVAPVTATPVALAGQKTLPMLRALAAHGHIQAQPITTLPDAATGYYALGCLSTNDPDIEPYAGRAVRLPDGTERVISLPHNAVPATVDTAMAAQVNRLPDGTTRTPPLVTVGQSVRAVWLPDAADYVAPELLGPSYYTAAQVDSLLADIGTTQFAEIPGQIADGQVPDTIARVAAVGAALEAKLDRATLTNRGDLLVRDGDGAVVRLGVGADGRVLTADSTVAKGVSWQLPLAGSSGGGGGGGTGAATLPEYSRAAQTVALGTPSDLLEKTTRFDTATAAISQQLPTAVAGRRLAVGWEAGANALTLTAASRTDPATVTSGSATVQDTAIVADDSGRAVSGTGIPANTFVGTVTPGASFLLSSVAGAQVNVSATASGTSVTLSDGFGADGAASLTVPLVGDVDVLHCTHAGRWRLPVGRKRQSSLDGRYVPSSQRGPIGGVVDLGSIASGATVSPNAAAASHFTATLAAGGATLAAPTGMVVRQAVFLYFAAVGGSRTLVFGAGLGNLDGDSTSLTILSGKTGYVALSARSATTATVMSARTGP